MILLSSDIRLRQTQFLARLHLCLVDAPSNVACPPLAQQCTIDTSFDKAHVLKPRVALFLQLRASVGTLRALQLLLQRDPGFQTQRVPLPVPLAQPSAAVIGLSPRAFASLDDDFEGLAATKNTAAADHVEFFPSSLDIQRRFFVKCTSHPESIMDPNNQIGRLTSNTR